jgi:hypothetical protein
MPDLRIRPRPPAVPRPRRFTHPGWWIASAIFVALIVAGGVFVVVAGNGGADAPEAAPRPVPTAPVSSPAAPSAVQPTPVAAPAACPSELPAENQAQPTVAPAAQWLPVGRTVAPFTPQSGPVLDDGGVLRCYARTPVGALFAAANFLAALSDPDTLSRAVAELTAPGAGRDVLVELAATNPVAITGVGTPGELRGFSYSSVSLSVVAVSLVIRADNGGMVAAPITLVWAGDWQVQVPDDGNLTRLARPVTSLDGFVRFTAP